MADRSVVAVPDDELPIIDNIGFLDIKTNESSDSSDSFKVSGEEIKKMNGIDKNAKRRISNKISKAKTGIDGAGSKQIVDENISISGYDAFDLVEPPYNIDYLTKLYEISPPHYAAVNAKVSNIVGLGYRFIESRKTKRTLDKIIEDEAKLKVAREALDTHLDELIETTEKLPGSEGFSEILIKVWRDYETTGNGYLEVGRKKDGTIGFVGHISSKTIRIRRLRDGFVQFSGFKAEFFANFGAGTDSFGRAVRIPNPVSSGIPNEVIHISKYSPTSSYYGIPDIIAAKQAVAGNEFAGRYNLDFFENKAMPRYVIVLKGAKLGNQAQSALLQFFQTNLKGQNHRSLFIPLPASTTDNPVELKFEEIGSTIQDSSFTNYRKANLSDILMVHRVPITKISTAEEASLAIAKDADKTFKEQVCGPEQTMFNNRIGKIFAELTDAYVFKLNELTLTDEDTQSKIDERDVKNGILLVDEVRAKRGLAGVKGGNERVDLNADAKARAQAKDSATPRSRDSQRSAGATDSAGGGRNPKGEGRTVS